MHPANNPVGFIIYMILNQTARTENKIIKIDFGRLMQKYQRFQPSKYVLEVKDTVQMRKFCS